MGDPAVFDSTVFGLFRAGSGVRMKRIRLDDAYDRFLLGQGEYPGQVLVGVRPA